MKLKDESFFKTIRNFLTLYLPKQKCYSQNTINSYRIALNLFIDYLLKVQHVPIFHMSFSHFCKTNVIGFLDWLQDERHCSPSTRNQRLMALRAFAKYAGFVDVAQLSIYLELSNIPTQRTRAQIVEYLSEKALKSLLHQPNINSKLGLRDRFFMILMYDTAARCQEMLDLKLRDFVLNTKSPYVYITGKGSKTRTVPLMPRTIKHLNMYKDKFHHVHHTVSGDFLFYTTIHGRRNQMSPDNAAYFMKKYGQAAKLKCPEVPVRVHPHQLRHTRAIHLYRGGMPLALLSEFLGHVSISTTQVYAYADTEMKRNAIKKACQQSNEIEEKPIWENDEVVIRRLCGLI